MLLPGLWRLIAWEGTIFWHSPPCQSFHFPPFCLCPCMWYTACALPAVALGWILEGAVCVSPKSVASPLRGVSWESRSSFHCPNPHWFLQPEAMWIYFPGAGTLGWVVWSEPGITWSWGIPPNFYPQCTNVGLTVLPPLRASPCVLVSTPPTHLDECGFFKSFVVQLPYSLTFWWFWVIFVL